ncbi:NUDIX domain-containing protein [Clostridium sp. D2Q-14]|uniref:NUDIX domain-containing protein n=1 Tax=Anaeromonas gelatinilytica TaxID=2683194 RepID=UPI00193C1ADD|nr:NUDIX domain-containing protein [Anaeromonas gelatinilytica]MBS4536680.1 NUDIX domain-containing protein [Anaeromonas gelatinilytica]
MDVPVKVSSMGIVVAKLNLQKILVLILNCDDEWVFPKGHVELGESWIDAACREVKEESGVMLKQGECLGLIDEFSFYFEGEKAIKEIKVHLFVIS